MYARTKTVTRRMGWAFLGPGDVVMAVEKGMGLKRGETIKRIYPIEIISVRGEPLSNITPAEIVLEGFVGMTVPEFVRLFCGSHKGCEPGTIVNRIKFKAQEK
jgi:hypothetical protein